MKNSLTHVLLIFLIPFSIHATAPDLSAQNVSELIAAIDANDADRVRELIAADSELVNGQFNFRVPLQVAIQKADLGMMNILLDAGADINGSAENQSTCMCLAVQYGNVDVVKELLKRDPDINHADRYQQTPLMHALWGDRDVLLLILDAGADVNAVDQSGQTMLARACAGRRPETALLLIERGANVRTRDNNQNTPLISACQSGNMFEVVEKLIEGGADPSHANGQGYTAIHAASANFVFEKAEETLALLLENVDDVDLESQYNGTPLATAIATNNAVAAEMLIASGATLSGPPAGWAPFLHQAAGFGNARLIQVLIEAGADVNEQEDDTGFTPLHFAATSAPPGVETSMDSPDVNTPDFTAVASQLLDAGADADLASSEGVTALQIAINRGAAGIADLLISRVENPDVDPEQVVHQAARYGMADTMRFLAAKSPDSILLADGTGRTPLVIAAGEGRDQVVAVLVEAGVDANQPDPTGNTALAAAIAGQHEQTVAVLIAGGADIGLQDTHGRTPLHKAAWYGNEAIVRSMLNANVRQVPSATGNTPLHAAAWQGHATIVRLLAAAGGDVNAVDSDGWTPLHKAALKGNADVVAALLEAGADKTIKDAIGLTPLGYASSSGNEAVVEMLGE